LTETVIHEHRTVENPPDLKVELARGMKGQYGWTITFTGKDIETVLKGIQEADMKLRTSYGGVKEE